VQLGFSSRPRLRPPFPEVVDGVGERLTKGGLVRKVGQALRTRHRAGVDVDEAALAGGERVLVHVGVVEAHDVGDGRLDEVEVGGGHDRDIGLEPRERKEEGGERLGHKHQRCVAFAARKLE